MPVWATLTIAILSSGLLGTVVGALLQGRRERKRAVHNFAISEVTEFANAAPGCFDRVRTAIRARESGGGDEEAMFLAADEAVKDAARLVARLVIAAGGSKTDVGAVAIGSRLVLGTNPRRG